jgi:hypothetical protein
MTNFADLDAMDDDDWDKVYNPTAGAPPYPFAKLTLIVLDYQCQGSLLPLQGGLAHLQCES